MKRLKHICAFLLFCALICTPFSINARDVDEIQKDIDEYEEKIESSQNEADSAQKNIDAYKNELASNEDETKELKKEIAELEKQETNLEIEIHNKQKLIDEQKQAMSLRIKYFYEETQNSESILQSFVDADSLSDFLDSMSYEQDLYEYDKEQLDEYEASLEILEEKQEDYLAVGKDLSAALKLQESLQDSLDTVISDREEDLTEIKTEQEQYEQEQEQLEEEKAEEEQRQKEEEERLANEQAEAEAQSTTSSLSTGTSLIADGEPIGDFTGYDLTEEEISDIAVICEREQGTSKSGVASEASLIANRYQLHGSKYSSVYTYVRDSGWWGKKAATYMKRWTPKASSVETVRDVIVNGHRTLPLNVDEHDCISDITSVSNNGVSFDKSDRSQYISGVTKIHNRYGATYTFYCFAHAKGDPFGNTKN